MFFRTQDERFVVWGGKLRVERERKGRGDRPWPRIEEQQMVAPDTKVLAELETEESQSPDITNYSFYLQNRPRTFSVYN